MNFLFFWSNLDTLNIAIELIKQPIQFTSNFERFVISADDRYKNCAVRFEPIFKSYWFVKNNFIKYLFIILLFKELVKVFGFFSIQISKEWIELETQHLKRCRTKLYTCDNWRKKYNVRLWHAYGLQWRCKHHFSIIFNIRFFDVENLVTQRRFPDFTYICKEGPVTPYLDCIIIR